MRAAMTCGLLVASLASAKGVERNHAAIVAKLRQQLADASPETRAAAAEKLWEFDEPAESLLPTLIEIIASPPSALTPRDKEGDWSRERAIQIVGRIGPESKRAVPALVAALGSTKYSERWSATVALGEIGPEAAPAIDPLAKALRDTESHTFPFAHRAWCVSDEAARALRKIGPVSRAMLLAALSDNDQRVRANAADALGYLPAHDGLTVPALAKLLDNPHETVRALAAYALGRIGPPAISVAPQLAAHLNDPGVWTSYPGMGIGSSYSVVQHILVALNRIAPPPEAIVPAMVQALQRDRRISPALLEMLRHTGVAAQAAVPILEPLLDDPEQRLSAALALVRIDPMHASLLDAFRKALADPNESTTLIAARGLGDLGAKATAAIPDLYAVMRQEKATYLAADIAAAIVRIDPSDDKAMVLLAEELCIREGHLIPGQEVADATWKGLGPRAQPGVEMLLTKLKFKISDPELPEYKKQPREEEVRLRSAELLLDVSQPHPAVIEALVELSGSYDIGRRDRAVKALSRVGPNAVQAIPQLVKMLADEQSYVTGGDFYGNGGERIYLADPAIVTLTNIGGPAVHALRGALRDQDRLVRYRACRVLGAIGKPARPAADDLVAAMQDRFRMVRSAAAESIGKIGDTQDTTIAALTSLLADPHLEVRVAAAVALGQLGPAAKHALRDLNRARNDPYVSARNAADAAVRDITRGLAGESVSRSAPCRPPRSPHKKCRHRIRCGIRR